MPGSSNVTGSITLEKIAYGVNIRGQIYGLTSGLHGFHIHMNGDTADGCKAAGGHFNPGKVRTKPFAFSSSYSHFRNNTLHQIPLRDMWEILAIF